jgi:hypothetical protein
MINGLKKPVMYHFMNRIAFASKNYPLTEFYLGICVNFKDYEIKVFHMLCQEILKLRNLEKILNYATLAMEVFDDSEGQVLEKYPNECQPFYLKNVMTSSKDFQNYLTWDQKTFQKFPFFLVLLMTLINIEMSN